MEGIIEFAPFWLMYGIFAVVGVWCWQRMFYTLVKHPEGQRVVTMLGIVLLFTPSSITQDPQHFAPAVFVLILDTLGGLPPMASSSIMWLLAGLSVGTLVMAIRHLLVRLGTKTE